MEKIVKPLVSVIIPTYKRSKSLNRAIDSVLSQTYPNIEIIVVDDNGKGSKYQIETEKSLENYIKTDKIKYITHDVNRNGSAARNTGFKHSKGEYINFLDDDDVFLPKKIERQVEALDKSEAKYGATYCNSLIRRIQNITNRKISICTKSLLSGNICREYLMNECPFNTSTILFRRSVIQKLNGFDDSFVRHQDYELLIRFFVLYEIVSTGNEPLVVYDTMNDRGNVPNPEKDFEVKTKFMNTFSNTFDLFGIKNDVCHYMWLQCAINALISKNYTVYAKAIRFSTSYKQLSVRDFLLIIKTLIIGFLK